MPTVSVVIATFNWSSALKLAVQSVLSQTYSDFEILVIGDCCTDDSEQIINSFKDPRITWHNLPKNTGSQALPNKKGIELSKGKYIAYIGHDDIWHPKHLEYLVKAIKKDKADYACSLCIMVGPDNEDGTYKNKLLLSGFIPTSFFPPSSLMHKKSICKEIGSWQDYKSINIPPDAEFQGRMKHKKFISSKELTCFKFNSAWRKNSYVIKPIHQQETYINRIKKEVNFLYNEMDSIMDEYLKIYPIDIIFPKSYSSLIESLSRYVEINPQVLPYLEKSQETELDRLGFTVTQSRIYRGLE